LAILFGSLLGGCGGAFDATPSVTQQQLLEKLTQADRPLLLDVRTAGEFKHGHIPGAVNIDIRQLQRALPRLADYRHNEVIVYCETGARARSAIPLLKDAGFTRLALADGDMSGWRRARLPAERGNGKPVLPPPAAAPATTPAPNTAR
jgi:rhodanese-related sulfurtransferase